MGSKDLLTSLTCAKDAVKLKYSALKAVRHWMATTLSFFTYCLIYDRNIQLQGFSSNKYVFISSIFYYSFNQQASLGLLGWHCHPQARGEATCNKLEKKESTFWTLWIWYRVVFLRTCTALQLSLCFISHCVQLNTKDTCTQRPNQCSIPSATQKYYRHAHNTYAQVITWTYLNFQFSRDTYLWYGKLSMYSSLMTQAQRNTHTLSHSWTVRKVSGELIMNRNEGEYKV